jgi:hypothetical protein
MGWSGGNYSKGNAATGGWAGDASLGIGIEAGRHDTQDNDFATGINQCINKDGSNAFTGNPNLGGYIPTNLGAGTAAAPALCVNNDTNTGVFAPAADTWAIATNGTERVRVLSDGKVGIGTTAPADALEVATTSFFPQYWSGYPGASAGGTNLILRRSRGATVGTNTILQNNDVVGAFGFQGANGTTFTQCATIAAIIDGTPGASNDMPGRLEFYTSADGSGSPTERMRIDSVGRVGIAGSPNHMLQTNSFSNSYYPLYAHMAVASSQSNGAGAFVKYDNDSTTANRLILFFIDQGATGSGMITANGASAAAFGSFSDARLKENITNLPSQLAAICALRPVEFDYKDGSGHQIGFIAQEVQQIYPDLVAAGADGMLTLTDLNKNDARFIKAFQELNAKVEALEAQVEMLQTQVAVG